MVAPMSEPSSGMPLVTYWWCHPSVASTSRCFSKKPAVYLSDTSTLSLLSRRPASVRGSRAVGGVGEAQAVQRAAGAGARERGRKAGVEPQLVLDDRSAQLHPEVARVPQLGLELERRRLANDRRPGAGQRAGSEVGE